MNIRRFVATDMRAALAAIRGELGPDAVMLSSRKLPEGVEVIAAIDYDDSLLGKAGQSAQLAGIAADDLGVAQLDDYQRVAAPPLAIQREVTLAEAPRASRSRTPASLRWRTRSRTCAGCSKRSSRAWPGTT